MAKAKTTILVDLNEKPALEGLKNLTKKFTEASTEINQSLELVGKAYRFITGGISDSIAAVDKYVKLAAEQERVEIRATAAIRSRGKFTEEAKQELYAFNSALQQQLGIGDEVLLQQQGTLASLGVMPGKLKDATKETIGLAQATGMQLGEAAKMVAKLYRGHVEALKEAGIETKSAADAHKTLAAFFQQAEAQGQTLDTRIKVLNANYGDLGETIGFALTRSTALAGIVDTASQGLLELIKIFSNEKGQLVVNSFFQTVAGGFADMLDAMLGVRKLMDDIAGRGASNQQGTGWKDRLNSVDRELTKYLNSKFGDAGGSYAVPAARPGDRDFVGPIGAPLKTAADELSDIIENLSNTLRKYSLAPNVLKKAEPAKGAGGRIPPSNPYTHDTEGEVYGPPLTDEALDRMKAEGLKEIHGVFGDYNRALADEREKINLQMQTAAAEAKNAGNAWVEALEQSLLATPGFLKGIGSAIEEAAATAALAIGDMFASMVENLASGQNALEGFRNFAGGIIKMVGTLLVQLGTGGILAGTLGTFIPALATITGGPLGVAAGTAAVIGGGLMIALGNALGGGGPSVSASAPSVATAGASGFKSSAPQGFVSGLFGSSNQALNPIIINFNGPVGGSPRRIARDFRDLLRQGGTLLPGG